MATPPLLGQSSSLSQFAGPYVSDMLGKGAALSELPYQAYQGPLTAAESQLQNQAFTGLANLAVPQASMAGSFTGAGYTPPTAQQAVDGQMGTYAPATDSVLQQYMTPYLQGALQPQYDAANRQAQIAQQNLQGQYGKAGAYGGSRQGVAEAELQRGLLDRMAGITGQGYQQAFEQAQNQFNTEQGYGLQALAAQRSGGAEQRAIENQGVMADIAQFETERDYPFKQVQFQQSLLQGLPISTESRQYAEPSALGQFSGGASGIIGLMQGIGLLPTQQGTT
tara:strand:- start:1555 stop:2394 length:840 start_codon:yes stop_codon:yes gene_type:complete